MSLYTYNKQQFNSDVSINNINTQITSSNNITISGGEIDVYGPSTHTDPIYLSKDNTFSIGMKDPSSVYLGYGTSSGNANISMDASGNTTIDGSGALYINTNGGMNLTKGFTSLMYITTKTFSINPFIASSLFSSLKQPTVSQLYNNNQKFRFIGKITGGGLIQLYIIDNGTRQNANNNKVGMGTYVNICCNTSNVGPPSLQLYGMKRVSNNPIYSQYKFYYYSDSLSNTWIWFVDYATSTELNNQVTYKVRIYTNNPSSFYPDATDGDSYLTGLSITEITNGTYTVDNWFGINNTLPSSALDVVGDTSITGNTTIGNGITVKNTNGSTSFKVNPTNGLFEITDAPTLKNGITVNYSNNNNSALTVDGTTGNTNVYGSMYVGNSASSSGTIYMGGGAVNDSSYGYSVVESRAYSADLSNTELLMFKGDNTADRIRLKAGNIAFDINTEGNGNRTTENIKMVLDSNGRLGIGNTLPTNTLDVNGDIYTAAWVRTTNGLYAQSNDAYLEPNTDYYGAWKMCGNRVNTWCGINFPDTKVNLMTGNVNSGNISKECGFHFNDGNGWGFRVGNDKSVQVYNHLTCNGKMYFSGTGSDNNGINLPAGGSGITWGTNYSRIHDDGDLRICTDDNIHFYTGLNASSNGTKRMKISNSSDFVTLYSDSYGYIYFNSEGQFGLYPNGTSSGGWSIDRNGYSNKLASRSELSSYATTSSLSSYATTSSLDSYAKLSSNNTFSGYLNVTGSVNRSGGSNVIYNDKGEAIGGRTATGGNYFASKDNMNSWNWTPRTSIYSDYAIMCYDAIFIWSDRRIKTNIVDIDDNNALSIIRKIQPKTYEYVDKIRKSNNTVIGFIAQEIQEIIPNAVSIETNYIPNFYTNCTISITDVSNILMVTTKIDLSWNPLHDLSGNPYMDASGNACSDASGNKYFNIKLYDQTDNEINCKITTIIDNRTFLIDIIGTTFIDNSNNIILEKYGGYFLYGQEVDDSHIVDKSAIFTVVTAAVQDIDRHQQEDAVKISVLECKNADLEDKHSTLENTVETLQTKYSELEEKVTLQQEQITLLQQQLSALIAKVGL